MAFQLWNQNRSHHRCHCRPPAISWRNDKPSWCRCRSPSRPGSCSPQVGLQGEAKGQPVCFYLQHLMFRLQTRCRSRRWVTKVKATSTVLVLHLVSLRIFFVLGQQLLNSLDVRQVGLHVVDLEGHFSFVWNWGVCKACRNTHNKHSFQYLRICTAKQITVYFDSKIITGAGN